MNKVILRKPQETDGARVFELIKKCPPLDINSSYCNLLQCSHFANTSVAAQSDDALVGFVSGYLIPDRQNTLFIWQVAVDEKARGQGLASRMIKHIIARQGDKEICYLETTITAENRSSWALFERLAKELSASLTTSELFTKEIHFAGQHETEHLVRIGPLKPDTI